MASKTEIINMALIKIGQAVIQDITDDSNTARLSSAAFDQIVDEVIVIGPEKGWKFARRRISISADAAAPDFEYDCRYAVPSGCLKIVSVQVGGAELTDWLWEGDYILTSEEGEEIDVVYLARITDAAKYPPHFVKALYYMLAVHLAFSLSGNSALQDKLLNELEIKILPRAMAADERGKYVKEYNNDWQESGHAGANAIDVN